MHFRIFFIILLVLVLSFNGYSQSLRVVDSKSSVIGRIGKEVKSNIKIKNTSDKAIVMIAERVEDNLVAGQQSYFCLGNDCTDSYEDNAKISITLLPGQTIQNFVSILEPGLTESEGSIVYRFYDSSNPQDATEFVLNHAITGSNSKGVLYYSKKFKVTNVYPNPVNKIAIFDYTIQDEKDEAVIIIQNVLGSIISEQKLPSYQSKVQIATESLKPGVYFYTLQYNSQNLVTKKFIIKR